MASLTIRQLDDKLKQKLRVRAAHNGRSMEQEAREILRAALSTTGKTREPNLVESIRRKLAAVGGGIDLELPKRESFSEPPDFSE
jgi:plasmid stability protein